MEFPGVGTISYDPPPEDLRPFMRRKYRTWVRTFDLLQDGKVRRSDTHEEARRLASKLPAEEREAGEKERREIWEFLFLFHTERDHTTEDEIVEEWVRRVFAPDSEDKRKSFRFHADSVARAYFRQMDPERRGRLAFADWKRGSDGLDRDTAKVLFKAVDSNQDGFVDEDDFVYGILYFHYHSGPDSPFSLWFGPLIDE